MYSTRPYWQTPTKAEKPVDEELYLGLMSGTSMDGIDAALVCFPAPDSGLKLIATHSQPWADNLQQQLQALAHPGDDEINRLGQLDARVGEEFAAAALELLNKAGIPSSAVTAIGSHGQTIRHQPNTTTPFTLQIGDPSRIAEATGITTVADFRRRDMAAGGEGAPLAPTFHASLFRNEHESRCVLNIGGIANVTLLPVNNKDAVSGFDTGPGNCLLDAWVRRHLNQPFDQNGAWAASGKTDPSLLEAMLSDDYFQRSAPKSTGPEYFNTEWLDQHLSHQKILNSADIQATLTALAAESVTRAIQSFSPRQSTHIGMRRRRSQRHPHARAEKAAEKPGSREHRRLWGRSPDWVEAIAFAWLAKRTLLGLAGNLPSCYWRTPPRCAWWDIFERLV